MLGAKVYKVFLPRTWTLFWASLLPEQCGFIEGYFTFLDLKLITGEGRSLRTKVREFGFRFQMIELFCFCVSFGTEMYQMIF